MAGGTADTYEASHPRAAEPEPGDAKLLLDADRTGLSANWWLDLHSRRLHWSPEVWTIFGLDPDLPPDREMATGLIHPDDRDQIRARVAAWHESGEGSIVLVYRLITPAGEQRLLEVRAWLEPDAVDGRSPHAIGTIIDLTDATRLASARRFADEQRELVLRVSGDGICGLGPHGEVAFSNPAFRTMVRREAAEIEGALLHDLVHRDGSGSELHPFLACPYHPDRAGRTQDVDGDFVTAHGTRLEVGFVRVSVPEGSPIRAVISLRDASEQRLAARQLRASLEHVRALSAQRGSLLRQIAQAEERERLRIAADIHDDTVQTLRAVELGLERRQQQLTDPVSGRLFEEARRDVHEAATRLRGLMLELLPPMPQVGLAEAVEAYCASQFDGTDVVFEVQGEGDVRDPDAYLLAYRLAQEAIRNARKHSRGSCVSVALSFGTSLLVIQVTDDGVGIRDDDDRSAGQGGLRIIRQRTEAAGGNSDFGPGPGGHGTRVRIELPLNDQWERQR